ncbi:TIGR03621 family F420-dependent LLM class oxidoreductase [Mycobacterium sp.]|uniref:TIGR03621 family F420-dependent LLM class oxidoreductase n=1 Tax=Mycobacterium sp. TaxID=1785 RepID=UPI002C2E7219|nr:TIGR03621 family F420-dependent LLM class oxidoreductase [Mycobacterium sp.]HME49472.1 TIGR03621 family F420-dependent LLM class oxidoreductase [Mycobacterium sp.]
MSRAFRFGVSIAGVPSSRAVLTKAAARFAGLGFDVLLIRDHLDTPAPLPLLLAAAEDTTLRLGTYVLNAGFYKPALLARDAATVSQLTGGRLELGLGAGYVREEFEAAELPFGGAASRIRHLEHITSYLKRELPGVPILIAGSGQQVLGVAARHADTIGLTGTPAGLTGSDPLAERIAWVRRAAGDRFGDLELNLSITAAPTGNSTVPDLSLVRRFVPGLPDRKLLALPGVLSGSAREIADTLRGYRETYGVTYLSVPAALADTFATIIPELR